jgi:diphthamide synthase (EF-2-diphthine--ammonia ligase)
MPFLMFLLRGLSPKVWLAGAAALALGVVLFLVRKSGRDAERVERLIKQLENVKVSNEVDARVDGASVDTRKQLREKWTRR